MAQNIRVSVRSKPIKNGAMRSLFLDFWPPFPHPDDGRPCRREFLRLYTVVRPQSEYDRQANKAAERLAEAVRSQRQIAVLENDFSFMSGRQTSSDFIQFVKDGSQRRNESGRKQWERVVRLLTDFSNGKAVPFDAVTKTFVQDFRNYIVDSHKPNTAVVYVSILKTSLREAYKADHLGEDLTKYIAPIKKESKHRVFLTADELSAMARTTFENDVLRRAFLFSCLTGLRHSDISKLTNSEICGDGNGGYEIVYRMKKTKQSEVLPISEQAFLLCGSPHDPDALIFEGLPGTDKCGAMLTRWAKNSGIGKKITFHSGRHSYAVMSLSSGTSIYTLSRMLGHSSLKTTEIYSKVVDQSKRDAANKISIDGL